MFCWPEQITRPTQIQGVRKKTPPLGGNYCKAMLQERGYGVGQGSVAIFVNNLPKSLCWFVYLESQKNLASGTA